MATNDKWEPPQFRDCITRASENQTSDVLTGSDFLEPSSNTTTAPDYGHSLDTQTTIATNVGDELSVRNVAQDVSDELRLVMIGKTGTGKSATGNTLFGEKIFESKGYSKSVTKQCRVIRRKKFDTLLVVVDTPGFLDTSMSQKELVKHLLSCTCFTDPGLHAFLLVLRYGNRYIDEDQRAIELMKELFCEKFVDHTVVVVTGKDSLDKDEETLENFIFQLPETLRQMISSCKGGTVAISNSGTHDEREQEARKIIGKVEELVRKNGGKSQYYKTALSIAISKVVAEEVENILNNNIEIEEKIRKLKQQLERLHGEDPHTQQKREELRRAIRELNNKLVSRRDAQEMAYETTWYKWSVYEVCGVAVPGIALLISFMISAILDNIKNKTDD